MTRSAPPGAQAVLRAIRVLKAFTLEQPERDIGSLTEETGLSRATVHRLVAALESEGLLTRSAGKASFRLGATTAALGVRALRSSALREGAHTELLRLARETGETATLEVLSEGKMLILDEVLGSRLVGASPSLGTAWAVHATSTGKAILAEGPPDRLDELLRAPLSRFTPRTLTDRRKLEAELRDIKGRGYAIAREELEPGYTAVGAIVRTPMEEAHAALSVGGPSDRLDAAMVEKLGGLVKTCADDVATRLGYERG